MTASFFYTDKCVAWPLCHSRASCMSKHCIGVFEHITEKIFTVTGPGTSILGGLGKQSPAFLPRDAMLSAVYAVVMCLCVCVCVSVILRYCIKTAKRRDSSFLTPKFTAKFERDHPLWGRQMQMGWVKIGYFSMKNVLVTQKRYKIDA